MNLEEMKKVGVNRVAVSDSLNAPLLQLNVKLNENTEISNEQELKIYVDDNETNLTNRKTFVFNLSYPLQKLEEFIIEPVFNGNKIKMQALIKRKTKLNLIEKNIEIGDDLSGKTLNLSFPNILGTYSSYALGFFSSDKYRIVERFDHGVNTIDIINIQTTEVVETLYKYFEGDSESKINLTYYQLPDDFGTVSYVIDPSNQFARPFEYIKVIANQIISDEDSIEEVDYHPITLFKGSNYISTNYEGINLEIIYPKNADITKYFLWNSYIYGLNNDDKFLTLDDIYFKDCFTQLDDDLINALFNKLTIKCMNSINNNFSLDCDGNLIVNSLTTKVKNPIPELTELNSLKINNLTSKNNSFSLDEEGNLTVNSITSKIKDTDANALTFNKVYPVGSIYTSVVNTNPSTLFGGTWTRFAQGKVLVGVNESETEFNTVLKTGGSKSLQAHTHTGTTSNNGNHQHNLYSGYGDGGTYGQDALEFKQALSGREYRLGGTGGVVFTQSSGNHNHSFTTGSTGSGNAQNLQPYMTVYFWRRTA